MSYILDALRRSEQERSRTELPMRAELGLSPASASVRRWPRWLLGAAILVNLLLLAGLLWPAAEQAEPPAGVAPAPITPPPPSPVSLAELAGSERDPLLLPAPSAATPVQAAAPATVPIAKPDIDEAPELSSLPESFRRGLPEIPINVHVYAQDRPARFVLVNLKRYGEGAELPGGVRIARITPTGVILAYQGQRFRVTVR